MLPALLFHSRAKIHGAGYVLARRHAGRTESAGEEWKMPHCWAGRSWDKQAFLQEGNPPVNIKVPLSRYHQALQPWLAKKGPSVGLLYLQPGTGFQPICKTWVYSWKQYTIPLIWGLCIGGKKGILQKEDKNMYSQKYTQNLYEFSGWFH